MTETYNVGTLTKEPDVKNTTPALAPPQPPSRESRHDDAADKEQVQLNKEAAAAAAAAKTKILDKIKVLEEAIYNKAKELSIKYNEAEGDEEKQESIKDDMEAFSAKAKDEINGLYSKLEEDSEPFFVKGFSILWKIIKLKFKVIVDKMELEPDVKETQLKMVEIIKNNIDEIEKNSGTLDVEYALKVSNLLVGLENSISQNSSGGGGGGNGGGEAPGGALPAELLGAAGALGGAAGAAGALGGEAGAAGPAETDPVKDVGGGDGQGGGGIYRKRSHPKYINQISENRNKIFKKELEIINSIRRFHRSHTIRKRDKINSILGFKKSRNNRNRNHDGNTKRHRHRHKHRHNNHKHKSAKHIKK